MVERVRRPPTSATTNEANPFRAALRPRAGSGGSTVARWRERRPRADALRATNGRSRSRTSFRPEAGSSCTRGSSGCRCRRTR